MENIDNQIISFLVEKGLIQEADLEKVYSPDQPLAELSLRERLTRSGVLPEKQLLSAIEELFGVPFATKDDFPKEPLLIDHLPAQFMKESKFIPARLADNELTVIRWISIRSTRSG
jgi:hypothetical protein